MSSHNSRKKKQKKYTKKEKKIKEFLKNSNIRDDVDKTKDLEGLYDSELPKSELPPKRVKPIKFRKKIIPDKEGFINFSDFPKDAVPSCNHQNCAGDKKAMYWYELMYRLAFRCEEHKDMITSRIVANGKIDDNKNWRKAVEGFDKRSESRARENGITDYGKYQKLSDEFNESVRTMTPKEYSKWKKEIIKLISKEFDVENLDDFDQVYVRMNRYMEQKAKTMVPYLNEFGDLSVEDTEALYVKFMRIVKEVQQALQDEDEEKIEFYKGEISFDELAFLDEYGFNMQMKYFILNQSPSRVDFYEQLMYYFADKK